MEIANIILSIILVILIAINTVLDYKKDKRTEERITSLEKEIEELKKGE